MQPMPRVGILAIIQESNTFLPQPTLLEHFRQDVLLTGEAIRQRFAGTPHELGGFLKGLEQADIAALPVFVARALPYGTVTVDTMNTLLEMLLREVRQAGPLDGWLVAPHGATVSENFPDVDGAWLSALRREVGTSTPIIGTLDPHGNLSPQMVAATDALFAYRSNPHLDQQQRGLEAAALMARVLRGEVRPTQAATFPPMQINIERQCTDESPLKELLADFQAVRERPGVLGASLMLGFPYADVVEMGTSTLVVTDNNRAEAQRLANELAQRLWDHRAELDGRFVSIPDAVTQAMNSPGPVCLLDMGDNVGGGSPADGTLLAIEMHSRAAGPSLVIIADAAAVQAATAAGVGQRVMLTIGGKSDRLHGPPLQAEFTVNRLVDGKFRETEPRHGGFTDCDQGPTAIVSTDTGLTVMLTTRRMPPFSLKQLTTFGLQPETFQVIVAKGVNAPLGAYAPVCPTIIRANTPGSTTADLQQLTFHRRRKPMYPFERDTQWSASSPA
jgi:microcystin degradation protein MlrC